MIDEPRAKRHQSVSKPPRLLSRVRIRNFRCFEDLRIDALAHVNLVGGRNNAGKTALLEALFLLAGCHTTQLPTRLNQLRGYITELNNPREVWGWLFRDKDVSRTIRIEGDGKSIGKIELDINLVVGTGRQESASSGNLGQRKADHARKDQDSNAGLAEMLTYRVRRNGKELFGGTTALAQDHVKYATADRMIFPLCAFLTTRGSDGVTDAKIFSQLQETGADEAIIAPLQALEPRLRRVVTAVVDGVPMLRADLGGDRLVPIAFLGEGVVKLVSILLHIRLAAGGIVLVDEVESGFHHSVLESVWTAIRSAAVLGRTQVVATTHSLEMLRAAHRVFDGDSREECSYMRLERSGDAVKVVHYTPEALAAAISGGLEVR
ncbi:MAG: AAA family ATPase [Candidatus Eisenbacteria bacterium]|nr:AAA family ATPase [Candidatus Eisenbacteria bacterium]